MNIITKLSLDKRNSVAYTNATRVQKGGETKLKFYNVKTRQNVEIPDAEVSVITMKNGKKAAKAADNGVGLFKILSNEDAARLSS